MAYEHLNLPFRVIVPKTLAPEERGIWDQTLSVLGQASRENGIQIKSVRLHHHPANKKQSEHALGWADLDLGEIVLCGNDIDTALHEAAHVWSRNYHSPKWAKHLLTLYARYAGDKEQEYSATLAKDYPNAVKVVERNRRRREKRRANGSRAD